MFDGGFSRRPRATDLQKHEKIEAPVTPDQVRQGSQARENLNLLMVMTPHNRETIAHIVSKSLPDMKPEQTEQPFADLSRKLDLSLFDKFRLLGRASGPLTIRKHSIGAAFSAH